MHTGLSVQRVAQLCLLTLLLFVCSMFGEWRKAGAQNPLPRSQSTPEASASPAQSSQPSPASSPSPTATNPPDNSVSANSPAPPKVVEVVTKRAGLGDLVTLRVENLASLVQQSKCLGKEANCQKQDIILFLNGRPLIGDGPEVILPEENLLQFHLTRAEGGDDIWEDLLGSPTRFVKDIPVSVGLANNHPIQSTHKLELIVIYEWWFWFCFILLLSVIGNTIYLAKRTSLLRNSSSKRTDNQLHPYSLGHTQMAFWFVMVITSFILIWLITGEYDGITTSTLVLIGIGAGTALGADLVDSSKTSNTNDGQDPTDYKTEQESLTSRISEIKSALADPKAIPNNSSDLLKELDTKQARLSVVNAALEQQQAQTETPPSQGFFRDILTDSGGVSFHRFQIVVWTIILGIIFVDSVYSRLAMPEFNGTLLALMGISSGTYLGFKGTEK